jgi:Arc/MetJ-type ribon-helix-helix transcriptional regulator
MTIEIDEPELQDMIQQQLNSGKFRDAADVVGQAVRSLPAVGGGSSGRLIQGKRGMSGADLIAVMQRSPHKEIELIQPSVYIDSSEISEPVTF